MRSLPFTDQRRTPFTFLPSGIVQVSPFVHCVFDESEVGPVHASTESVDTAAPAPLKNLPNVALLPASDEKNGRMWMTPSPWVWRPVRTPGLYTVAPPGLPPIHYVFNADRKESDLARLSEAEVNDLGRSFDIPVVRSSVEYKALEARQRYGTELWKWALLALLIFLFLELILQQIFARSRGKVTVGSAVPKISTTEGAEAKR